MNTNKGSAYQLRTNVPQKSQKIVGSSTKETQEKGTTRRRINVYPSVVDGIRANTSLYSKNISNEKTSARSVNVITQRLQGNSLDGKGLKKKEKKILEDNYELDKADDVHRQRLLVGEADLSFAVALIEKHPEITHFITATTYEDEETLDELYPETFSTNKGILLERNVKVLHEVDATELHEDPRFIGKKYGHIHFNFPHDGKNLKRSDPTQTPTIISNFLASARSVLISNGHVHMALVTKGLTQTSGSNLGFYHGRIYKIADGTLDNNYKLYKKCKFDAERYEGYEHKMTNDNRSSEDAARNGREYIFEKIDSDDEDEINENKKRFLVAPTDREKKYLPEIETDSESSDYEV